MKMKLLTIPLLALMFITGTALADSGHGNFNEANEIGLLKTDSDWWPMGGDWGHMMPGMGTFFWGMGFFGFFFTIIFWAVVILVIYWFIQNVISRQKPQKDPLEILKERYAKGEITKEEFESMKKDLL